MASLVHTSSEIQSMLRLGLAPITDNVDALIGLGFERAYPQLKSGYEASIWERSVDLDSRGADDRRRLVRERAFLV